MENDVKILFKKNIWCKPRKKKHIHTLKVKKITKHIVKY
jgi:hypothetical protein